MQVGTTPKEGCSLNRIYEFILSCKKKRYHDVRCKRKKKIYTVHNLKAKKPSRIVRTFFNSISIFVALFIAVTRGHIIFTYIITENILFHIQLLLNDFLSEVN